MREDGQQEQEEEREAGRMARGAWRMAKGTCAQARARAQGLQRLFPLLFCLIPSSSSHSGYPIASRVIYLHRLVWFTHNSLRLFTCESTSGLAVVLLLFPCERSPIVSRRTQRCCPYLSTRAGMSSCSVVRQCIGSRHPDGNKNSETKHVYTMRPQKTYIVHTS